MSGFSAGLEGAGILTGIALLAIVINAVITAINFLLGVAALVFLPWLLYLIGRRIVRMVRYKRAYRAWQVEYAAWKAKFIAPA